MHLIRITWPSLLASLVACHAAAQGGAVQPRSPLQVVEHDAHDRDLRTTPVVRAVQRAADSVVSIYLQHQLARREPMTEGQGSGVILDEAGLVITNWHVVAPLLLGDPRGSALDVVVKLRDGRTREAQVLTSTAKRDLALLQMRLQDGEKVKPIEIARSSELMVGETVIAIGTPQGHANTVTTGVLSAIGRSIRVRTPDGSPREYSDLLQTDAAINQGNSGGALLDITGRLIGINNAMAVGAENIGFAIPMDIVRAEFERELIRSASFTTAAGAPWLGLEVADRDGAVVVTEVTAGSPAADAGVQVGDVLARIGDHDVRSSIDYVRHFFGAQPRGELLLVLRRADRDVRATAVRATRDEWTIRRALGALVEETGFESDAALARKATSAFYRGSARREAPIFPAVLRVRDVSKDSPAHGILQPGDVVLGFYVRERYGERELPVTAARDLLQLLGQSGGTIRISILRGDEDLIATLDVRRTNR